MFYIGFNFSFKAYAQMPLQCKFNFLILFKEY